MIARVALAAALLVGAAVTLAGLSAPIYPPADLINHFRPFLLAGACALLAAALVARPRQLAWGSAVLVGLNTVLLALPLLWSADHAERSTAGQALANVGGREIKLVTFNTRFEPAQRLAPLLTAQDADIVVLQEIAPAQAGRLATLLHGVYPHSHACRAADRCAAAILAKRAWVASGRGKWTNANPETIWVQFDDAEHGRLSVVGVHLALPFRSEQQTSHIARLLALRGGLKGPLIVAGDFNMTPWSYRLQRFLASAGLRRHATFLRSWPTDGQFRLPLPTFLIDHVLTTPDVKSVAIRIGPDTGSDHLPVIAQLRLPAR